MFLSKIGIATAILLVIGTMTAGVVTHVHQGHATAAPPDAPKAGEAMKPGDSGVMAFRKVGVGVDELIQSTGLDIYKYQVDMPKGQRFHVMIRELKSKEAPARVVYMYPFKKLIDGQTTILISFLRRDHQLRGVLLNQEREAEFRVDAPGTDPGGIATIVALPAIGAHDAQRTLLLPRSDKDYQTRETTLLALVVNEPGKPAPNLPDSYPRIEVVLVKDR